MPDLSQLPTHVAFTSAPNISLAGSVLAIDTKALANNYNYLASQSDSAQCAAVIKADGYGTGLEHAAQSLWDAGCRIFFVALPQEGIRARSALPNATLYILNGLISDECAEDYQTHELRPVLGSMEEIKIWDNHCTKAGEALPCALHFDTGMNRLGLSRKAAYTIKEKLDNQSLTLAPALIMSHLACADEPRHSLNSLQLDRFREIRALFPGIDASLSNSAGIFLGPDFHFDLLRPGISLYGGQPTMDSANPMQPVATLKSRVLAQRHVPQGQSISYGASQITKRDSRIATLSVGYADGYLRSGSSSDAKSGAKVWLDGYEAPIIGRITMDLIMIDVTDIPEELTRRGQWVELFGPNIPIDDVASIAGTISYEILTSLGLRAQRQYL